MLDHENKMMAKFKAEREAKLAEELFLNPEKSENPDDLHVVNRGKSKQVIVMRTDLGMRKGKMIAQGCHASLKAILDQMYTLQDNTGWALDFGDMQDQPLGDWLLGKFTKICVKGNSEDHIKELYEKAKMAGLPCSLIQDAGLTEFSEPTYTCIAIGPGWTDDVDKITGGLELL